ncbi:MAG TPA: 2,5-diamino-6-(ribosylamino)-4(3H)-pyrimidinone 5'-phosphate reductase [Candidatus Nitrosotenuis sp.]|nr:2,5-diamino-6-(ribosylamino)-4(3H)-pyrimidinone 5'-phosphate reductase [Candidatus Nitrosotenuis sp.]
MEKSRPHIILSAAVSLDGKIATKTGDSELSSGRDKVRVHRLRASCDAIVVGKNTVKKDDPLLTVRYAKGKNPTRIILDSRAEIPINSKIIKTSKLIPTIIAVSKKAPKKNLAKLAKHPVRIITVGKDKVEIKKLLQILYEQGIRTILLEGGGTTNWDFVRKRFVDEVIVTISPCLIGGTSATTLVEGEGFAKIANSMKLKLRKTVRYGSEIVLHYQR